MPQAFYNARQRRIYFRVLMRLVHGIYWMIAHVYYRMMPLTRIDEHYDKDLLAKGISPIWSGWHQYMYFILQLGLGRQAALMVSRSNSGSVAAAMVEASGNIAVRGGSRNGGMEALDDLIGFLRRGHTIGIVADAPRGPAYRSKIGPIIAAQRSGHPIIPVGLEAKRKWTLPGWDRGWIPKPFSPVCAVFGAPIYVPADAGPAQMETKRLELEAAINAVHDRARAFFEFAPVVHPVPA